MYKFLTYFTVFLAITANSLAFDLFPKAQERKHIRIVGSSTVYPFTAVIAETFGRDTEFRTPIVEATGTGGGMKLFCEGIGYEYPDFVDASREIKKSEIEHCAKNGVTQIKEIKIGYDGIVLANSNEGEKYHLSEKQIFLALAKKVPVNGKLVNNPYKKWSDIDKKLPKKNIAIYGPPPTSGTRDAFVELLMEKVCDKIKLFKITYPNNKNRKKKCHALRSDGGFIEAGENDNLIVQKLRNDSNALGIFGFSFLEENRHLVQPVEVQGIEPTSQNIKSGKYSLSRPLFIYFKKEHQNLVPGTKEFVQEIISPNTVGDDGYLMQKGLIPLKSNEVKDLERVLK